MLSNFAFTLYEVFGYLVPGCIALAGIVITYWSLFAPKVALNFATYTPGTITGIAVIFVAYILGHALHGLTNPFWKQIEYDLLFGNGSSTWLGKYAVQLAAKIAATSEDEFAPISKKQIAEGTLSESEVKKVNGSQARKIFRVLDSYNLQFAKPGDRDIFVYREGFYRAAFIGLFILALALILRALVPGAAINFAKGLFVISCGQLLLSSFLLCAIARIFIVRFRRFAEYRVTHAVLSTLVLDKSSTKQSN